MFSLEDSCVQQGLTHKHDALHGKPHPPVSGAVSDLVRSQRAPCYDNKLQQQRVQHPVQTHWALVMT